jgi:hypothetical protein
MEYIACIFVILIVALAVRMAISMRKIYFVSRFRFNFPPRAGQMPRRECRSTQVRTSEIDSDNLREQDYAEAYAAALGPAPKNVRVTPLLGTRHTASGATMFSETWRAIRRAMEGLAELSHASPAYFVIPIERAASSLRPGQPIPVSSAPAAIEVANCADHMCRRAGGCLGRR